MQLSIHVTTEEALVVPYLLREGQEIQSSIKDDSTYTDNKYKISKDDK